jgi:hypothetical protein
MGKLGEKLAPIPKTAVRKRVALNGNDRPRISETVPQPTAPIIIWTSVLFTSTWFRYHDSLLPSLKQKEVQRPPTSDQNEPVHGVELQLEVSAMFVACRMYAPMHCSAELSLIHPNPHKASSLQ